MLILYFTPLRIMGKQFAIRVISRYSWNSARAMTKGSIAVESPGLSMRFQGRGHQLRKQVKVRETFCCVR